MTDTTKGERDRLHRHADALAEALKEWLCAYDSHALQCHNANQFPLRAVDDARTALAAYRKGA